MGARLRLGAAVLAILALQGYGLWLLQSAAPGEPPPCLCGLHAEQMGRLEALVWLAALTVACAPLLGVALHARRELSFEERLERSMQEPTRF